MPDAGRKRATMPKLKLNDGSSDVEHPVSERIHKAPAELLDDGGWFAVPNLYLDVLVRELHPHDFIVLLVLRRLSYGFRRRTARVSQNRIASLSGLSRRSAQRAIARLKAAGHILEIDPGAGRRSAEYTLAEDLEMELAQILEEIPSDSGVSLARLPDATTDKEAIAAPDRPPRVANLTPLGSQPDATMSTPKYSLFKDIQEKDISVLSQKFAQFWPLIREDLRGQLTAATFATYFWSATIVPSSNGELILQVNNSYTAAWIENRLMRPLMASLRAFLGEDITEEQVVIIPSAKPPGIE